tara:strand:+ start:490 stop:615 length:126 start_codon:yes stop_codon:yes gene_type:complete
MELSLPRNVVERGGGEFNCSISKVDKNGMFLAVEEDAVLFV